MTAGRVLSHPVALLACRLLLGTVFVIAAIPKIARPESFATAIEAYEMIPLAVVNIAAILFPWIELACGLFLIAGVYVRPGAALLGILLTVFIVAITTAVLRGLNINCGCFGESGGSAVGWNRVLEDIVLLVPAWILYSRGGGRVTGTGASGPPGDPA